ncbi:MAG: hypothetical protein ACKO0W_01765 [Planctomycetota bacterium]
MARLQSFSKLRPRDEVGPSAIPLADGDGGGDAESPRARSRVARASADGVWTAALFLALVAFLMPLWYLGVGTAIAASAGEGAEASRVWQIVLLGFGCVAVWFGVRSSFILARAPRLGRGHHRATMRRLAIATGVLALVFLQRFVANPEGLSSDILAFAGALAPAILLAEASVALPAVAKGRHGTRIGSIGGLAWTGVAVAVVAVGFAPALWWMPTVVALGASACTGLAAVRVWRRYEGRIVTA